MRSLIFFAVICIGEVHGRDQSAVASPPPNIVLIVADDLGWGEAGCYGQKKISTPHIDQLAAEGLRFTQFYAGAPVCAPSRCVLLTGLHLGHAEIRGNRQASRSFPEFKEGQHPLSNDARVFPQLLQQAGYATGAMGKWGLGPVGSSGEPNRKGFDLFFGYNCQAVAHSFFPPTLWKNRDEVIINHHPVPGHAKQPEGDVRMADWIAETYASRPIVAEAEAFIAAHANKPFLLFLPFTEPHVAMHPPIETVNRFPQSWDDTMYRGGNGYLPHPRPRAGYAAMIAELDDHVGRVMAALDKAGVTDRTLVIFTSDNGTTHEGRADPHFHIGGVDATFFNSTAGLRGYKGSVYEGGLRVPCIMRFPGRIPAGRVSEVPAWFPDIFPTVCEAAGTSTPEGLDGVSLWGLLADTGTVEDRPSPLLWVFPEYGGQMAVRLGDMKAVRRGLLRRSPSRWEVYDVAKDPNETTDLARDHSDVIQRAVQVLNKETHDNVNFPMPKASVD